MAGVTLTQEQQEALDQFETDAQAAKEAKQADEEAKSAAMLAAATADSTAQGNLVAHQKALESAQRFVNLMVPPSGPAPSLNSQASKGKGQ